MTKEELQTQINAQLKSVLAGVAGEIKKYVDGKDDVLKSDLSALIDEEVKKITGIEGDLKNLQELANSIKQVLIHA